jgi:LysM repeat protein
VYSPGSLTQAATQGEAAGTTKLTVTGASGSTFQYTKNPAARTTYGTTAGHYSGTPLTSGTTEIPVTEGDVIEVVNLVASKVASVGYITVKAGDIKPVA